jgi:hypothetical protein
MVYSKYCHCHFEPTKAPDHGSLRWVEKNVVGEFDRKEEKMRHAVS